MAFNFPAAPLPQAPPSAENLQRWAQIVAVVVNRLLLGKLNCTGDVTLTASSTTTTLTDARITASSVICFMPTTENAAYAHTTLRVTDRANGSATLTHASDPTTDRTFGYAIFG